MPVTTLIAILVAVLSAGALTVLAIGKWGMTMLPFLAVAVLAARWALAEATPDDTNHP